MPVSIGGLDGDGDVTPRTPAVVIYELGGVRQLVRTEDVNTDAIVGNGKGVVDCHGKVCSLQIAVCR